MGLADLIDFSMRDVQDEFGTNTEPSPPTLRNYMDQIFENSPDGETLRRFTGYGRPSLDPTSLSASTSSTDGGFIDVSYTVSAVNNLDVTVGVEVAPNDGRNLTEEDWTNISSSVHSSIGNYSQTGQCPNTNTSYFVRLKYYNKFTILDDFYSPSETSTVSVTSSQEPPPPPPPNDVTNVNFVSSDGLSRWTYYWDYPSTDTTYQAQYQIDGGSWVSFTPSVTLASDGKLISNLQAPINPNNGNEIRLQWRKTINQGWTTSKIFQLRTGEDGGGLENPSITTLSATNVGEDSAGLRMSIDTFNDVADQEFQYWIQYRKVGNTTWQETGRITRSTTATSLTIYATNLDSGTNYEFRAVAKNTLSVEPINTIYGSELTFTTDVPLSLNPPENVTIQDYSTNGFQVTWDAPSTGGTPDRYRIQFSNDNFQSNIWTITSTTTSTIENDVCFLTGSGFHTISARVRSENSDGSVTSAYQDASGFVTANCP